LNFKVAKGEKDKKPSFSFRVNPPKIKKEIHFDENNKCVFGQVRDPPK
jgi:hypothetical protein